jgi:hypothetical protein
MVLLESFADFRWLLFGPAGGQMALVPVSPVRMRTTSMTSVTKILPSPILGFGLRW